jgi:hypothetical protein
MADPSAYSSFADYLGANAKLQCERCDHIVEYDEVNEDGHCFDCQPEWADEEWTEDEDDEE